MKLNVTANVCGFLSNVSALLCCVTIYLYDSNKMNRITIAIFISMLLGIVSSCRSRYAMRPYLACPKWLAICVHSALVTRDPGDELERECEDFLVSEANSPHSDTCQSNIQ